MTADNISLFVQYQRGIFLTVLIVLGLLFFVSLVRAVKGPRVADRLVAVNMIGTMVMVMIAVLSVYWQEEYLLDICLIYAMASFLAVIVITKVYIGIYEEQHPEDGKNGKTVNPAGADRAHRDKEEGGADRAYRDRQEGGAV